MKSKIILFKVIFVFLLFNSCTEKSDIIKFIFLDGTILKVNDFVVYENSDNGLYVYIKNSDERNKVFKYPIKEVTIVKNNISLKGKKVDIFYSIETKLKPFIYYVNNNTQIIMKDELNNFEVFFIGFKNDLLEIIDSNLIEVKSIDDSCKS